MKNLSNIADELDIVTKEYVDDIASTKVEKIEGKGLSTNDFTNENKNKLEQLNIVQVSEFPIANAMNVGNIIQYIGVTNESYTNGFFYKNIEISNGVYNWINIQVQEGNASSNNYDELENKPTLNGIEINGNKTAEDYGINNSNIHYGASEPSEDNVVMWIDPDETPVSVLTTDNNIEYIPTGDYNPATKKYVDDSIANINIPEADLTGLATEEYVNTQVSTKANISSVLTKTNTTAFTPTANYHPATKKYVDDNIGGSNVLYTITSKTTANSSGKFTLSVGLTAGKFYNLKMFAYLKTSKLWFTPNTKSSASSAGMRGPTTFSTATTPEIFSQSSTATLVSDASSNNNSFVINVDIYVVDSKTIYYNSQFGAAGHANTGVCSGKIVTSAIPTSITLESATDSYISFLQLTQLN